MRRRSVKPKAALNQAIAVNAAFLFDPRYDAESWMRAHVGRGDTIETYPAGTAFANIPTLAQPFPTPLPVQPLTTAALIAAKRAFGDGANGSTARAIL